MTEDRMLGTLAMTQTNLSATHFFRHLPWRKKPKTTPTQMSQPEVIPQKTTMCSEHIVLLKWKRNCHLDDEMKRKNLLSSLVPFLKRCIFLLVQTVISTRERRNHTLATAKWVSPDWRVVFLLSRNKPQFTFANFKACSTIHNVQQQTVELIERSVSGEATRSEWELFLRLINLFFHVSRHCEISGYHSCVAEAFAHLRCRAA